MTTKEALQLTPGQCLEHTRYGKSRVKEVIGTHQDNFFGVVIIPLTTPGKRLLFHDSESAIVTFLEDSPRNLKHREYAQGTRKRRKLDLIDIVPDKNMKIELFRDKKDNPAIPPRPLQAIAYIQNQFKGDYVDGGRIVFENELETIFQEYTKGLGWSGYDFIFCKFRFKGPKYVTFVFIDKQETVYVMSIEDGIVNFTDMLKDFNKNQDRILRQATEHVAGIKLPYPVITYNIE